ncbi:MAG: ABC transporter substrate-binding protein, partial [Clostridia bacterium]|nr:ABC transporter substrate-binding protein [Clostridia bacterium]
NRILGIKWLGNLLYPEIYGYDMTKETREFYKLFYHYDLSDEELTSLLKDAGGK